MSGTLLKMLAILHKMMAAQCKMLATPCKMAVATHLIFNKDKKGGLRCPPGAPSTPIYYHYLFYFFNPYLNREVTKNVSDFV